MQLKEDLMEDYKSVFKRFAKQSIAGTISINDLREKEENGILNKSELRALVNFERYRIKKLNAAQSEEDFHNRYRILRVLSNLSPYQDFLDKKYDVFTSCDDLK